MKKQKSNFGLITGLIYCVICLATVYLFELTIGAFYAIIGFLTAISVLIMSDSEMGIVYLGTGMMVGAYIFYLAFLFALKPDLQIANILLIITFTTILIFGIPIAWISGVLTDGNTSDAQYLFHMMEIPLKICWIYPLLGLFHDYIFRIYRANKRWENRP